MSRTVKYLACFKVETNTPLSIGTGKDGLLNERLVARDVNGLPYIPGTSMAGVIRHELEKGAFSGEVASVFGYQNVEDGRGSCIFFTDGVMVAEDGETVLEGACDIDYSREYYAAFRKLPARDHVRIDHIGVAAQHGKFEEQLVYKGVRFVFEIELEGREKDKAFWDEVIQVLNHPAFRLGGGTRNGFGQLKVLSCHTRIFDLTQEEDLIAYLERDNSLNASIAGWESISTPESDFPGYHYRVDLEPSSFFLFGAGYSGDEADALPKKERLFEWDENGPKLSDEYFLVPATSVKGALAHRVAYHYNRIVGNTVESLISLEETPPAPAFDINKALDSFDPGFNIETLNMPTDSLEWKELERIIEDFTIENSDLWKDYLESLAELGVEEELPVGEGNPAVQTLFGHAKTDSDGEEENGARGKVILSDLYIHPEKVEEKIFNHVSIDRFTGGARDGALFTQKATWGPAFRLDIFVEKDGFVDETVRQSFEATLDDLTSGSLPIGASVNKGHGGFKGEWKIVQDHE